MCTGVHSWTLHSRARVLIPTPDRHLAPGALAKLWSPAVGRSPSPQPSPPLQLLPVLAQPQVGTLTGPGCLLRTPRPLGVGTQRPPACSSSARPAAAPALGPELPKHEPLGASSRPLAQGCPAPCGARHQLAPRDGPACRGEPSRWAPPWPRLLHSRSQPRFTLCYRVSGACRGPATATQRGVAARWPLGAGLRKQRPGAVLGADDPHRSAARAKHPAELRRGQP